MERTPPLGVRDVTLKGGELGPEQGEGFTGSTLGPCVTGNTTPSPPSFTVNSPGENLRLSKPKLRAELVNVQPTGTGDKEVGILFLAFS